jgi:putative ATP-dependent endonuclease of the OLD family
VIIRDGTGSPDLYTGKWNEDFAWYPYLVLQKSKPETHIAALARLGTTELANGAPEELDELLVFIEKSLGNDAA